MPPPYRRPKAGEHEVLISPGYGAGWSSWVYERDQQIFALTDPKVIKEVKRARRAKAEINQTVIADFVRRFERRFPGWAHFYEGAARDLDVRIVSGPFIVNEYDGSESIQHGHDHFIDLDKEG